MPDTAINRMISLLDEATRESDLQTLTSRVKDSLVSAVRDEGLRLSDDLVRPCHGHYARRLMHADTEGRYTVVIMVWGAGQETPIHDHGQRWCVECVYQGQIRVSSYALQATDREDRVLIDLCQSEDCQIGTAGALIPPHDHHVIANPHDETAVTIHVYGGEMDGCHVYEPEADGIHFGKTWRELSYTAG